MRYINYLLTVLILFGCISNDIIDDRVVDEQLSYNFPIENLAITKTYQLTTKYTNNVGVVSKPKITWTSSDNSILNVSENGLITAVSLGKAIITAKVINSEGKNVSTSLTIVVIPFKKTLTINNIIEDIIVNTEHQYQTTFINTLGVEEDTNIIWSSSNSNIASISSTGLMKANRLGKVTITAKTISNGEEISSSDEFTVNTIGEMMSINNPLNKLMVGETHQYTTTYTDNTGQNKDVSVSWSSSNEAIASINQEGFLTATNIGEVTIKASYTNANGEEILDTNTFSIQGKAVNTKSGTIRSTSSYELTGTFMLSEIPGTNNLELKIENNYKASTSLPGLYLYLTNNPNTIANAKKIQKVAVFNGAHSYIIENTSINEFSHLLYWCKPFSVKVGDGEIIE